nr:hypothetical protein [Rhodococcus sp. ZPP]
MVLAPLVVEDLLFGVGGFVIDGVFDEHPAHRCGQEINFGVNAAGDPEQWDGAADLPLPDRVVEEHLIDTLRRSTIRSHGPSCVSRRGVL